MQANRPIRKQHRTTTEAMDDRYYSIKVQMVQLKRLIWPQSMQNQHPMNELQWAAFRQLQRNCDYRCEKQNKTKIKERKQNVGLVSVQVVLCVIVNVNMCKHWKSCLAYVVPNALVIPSLPIRNNETTAQVFSMSYIKNNESSERAYKQ